MYAGFNDRRTNWAGIGFSVLLHGGVAAAFLLNISLPHDPFVPKPDRTLSVFNVPLARMERMNAPIEAVPTKPKPSNEISDEPPPPTEETVDASAAGDIEINWTPPPPPTQTAKAVDIKAKTADRLALIRLPDPDPSRRNLTPEFISGSEGAFVGPEVRQAAARLSGRGTVTLRFNVTVDGAVTDCEISSSSGSGLLDAKACELIVGFSYKPGTDDKGAPVVKSVLETIEWLSDDGIRRVEPEDQFAPSSAPISTTPVRQGAS